MSTIIYGGNHETVTKQISCPHKWSGPCIDNDFRYRKCERCYCLEIDGTYQQWISIRNVLDVDMKSKTEIEERLFKLVLEYGVCKKKYTKAKQIGDITLERKHEKETNRKATQIHLLQWVIDASKVIVL